MPVHTCPRPACAYTWTSRVPDPKACPRCKGRLDNPPTHTNGGK